MRAGGRLAAGAALLTIGLTATLPPAAGEPATDAAPAIDARALLDRAYRNLYDHDFVQVLRISAGFPGGRHFERRLQIVRKQSHPPGRALVRFLDPPDIRRTAMLLIESPERYDSIYLFIPAFDLVRHVAVMQRADAFFGTDINFEDLEPKYVERLEVRSLGAGQAAGKPCWRIESRSAAGVESTYERLVSCVDPDRSVVMWTDFYRAGEPHKRLEVDPRSVQRVGDRWIPFGAVVRTPNRGTETRLETESYEPRDDLPESIFTAANLEFGDAARDRAQHQPD